MAFKEISIKELKINPFTMISDEWMLITSGNKNDGFNTMTASWGMMGALWDNWAGKPVVEVLIRPTRYTKEFVDNNDYFTISVFPSDFKKDLIYLGTHSGRNEDKISETSLNLVKNDDHAYFEEAKLVFVCRKIYVGKIHEEGFVDKSIIDKLYPKRDFHTTYIGQIEKVLVK